MPIQGPRMKLKERETDNLCREATFYVSAIFADYTNWGVSRRDRTAGRAIRSYCTGISRRPVSTTIANVKNLSYFTFTNTSEYSH